MKIIAEISADSFPVGMDISSDGKFLIVTSQGKYNRGGGDSVMVYKINISSKKNIEQDKDSKQLLN